MYEALVLELLFARGFGHCGVVANRGSAKTVSVVLQFPITDLEGGTNDVVRLSVTWPNIDISCSDHATLP